MTRHLRILVLTANVGSGHNKTAEALVNALKEKHPAAEFLTLDSFKYANALLSKVVISTYMEIIKVTPSIYRYLYDQAGHTQNFSDFNRIVNSIAALKLKKVVRQFEPDLIINTHAFPSGVSGALKSKGKINVPVVSVITDFHVHPFWVNKGIDGYFIAHEELIDSLINMGVTKEKIFATGIPIRKEFSKPIPGNIDKISNAEDCKTILIMGGGSGLGPMRGMVKNLCRALYPIEIKVITGKNWRLYKYLNEHSGEFPVRVEVYGFVDNISELMREADIIVSKPGGITSAEILAIGKPMLITKPIPGQEERNAEFLVNHGAAVCVTKLKEFRATMEELLNAPDKTKKLSSRALELGKPMAAEHSAQIISEQYLGIV